MQELLIILVIVLILFGGRKIPELFSGLGKGIKSFKKSMNEEDDKEQISKEAPDSSSEQSK